ncbi:hypothetical protein XHC_0077 [Xanthomonas hortorum pv. carotae str. M081]|nr:hypothetical protein XHC_0077 [Xanthomonas hortorum pv. carotae str. M081]
MVLAASFLAALALFVGSYQHRKLLVDDEGIARCQYSFKSN